MENKHHTRLSGSSFFFAVLAIFFLAASAHAQALSLKAPAIANEDGILTARFGVAVEDKPIFKGELEDGAELVLKCDVSLEEVSNYWINNKIAAAEFVSVVKFDALTKEFVMTVPSRSTTLRSRNLDTILESGWGTIEVGLGPWAALERGQQYSLSINTTMIEAGAPEGLSRFIYFWSWDAGTDTTFILNFTY